MLAPELPSIEIFGHNPGATAAEPIAGYLQRPECEMSGCLTWKIAKISLSDGEREIELYRYYRVSHSTFNSRGVGRGRTCHFVAMQSPKTQPGVISSAMTSCMVVCTWSEQGPSLESHRLTTLMKPLACEAKGPCWS